MKRGVSHREAAAFGWKRIDPQPWRSKLVARWVHRDGWTLAHCGHPTALWPWDLSDPQGVQHRTGGLYHGNPKWGVAWPDLRTAFEYVASLGKAVAS